MMRRWYVTQVDATGPTRLGPMSSEALLQGIADGGIRSDAFVTEFGATQSLSILEVDLFRPAFAHPSGVGSSHNGPEPPRDPMPSFPTPPLHHYPPAPTSSPRPSTALPASSAQRPPPPQSPRRGLVVAGAAAVVLLFAVVAVAAIAAVIHVRSTRGRPGETTSAVVRIVMKSSSGTGFFVAGPDDAAYVATAYHVVDSGEPILIERSIETPGRRSYIEAYPEAEIVAFDADADLAVIRIDNVQASHFTTLSLAHEPVKDENTLSYGFPASNLARRFGMVSKPGKVLSLVRFPARDHRTGEVIRKDAVDGLLISAEIEPGFSGGPTCNERGEVVGVNVTKDNVYRAQNGAVNASVLRQLLSHVTPKHDQKEPTAFEVKALLDRIEREYLLLPVDRRSSAPEQEFLAGRDMPRLDDLITEIRKLENDSTRNSTTELSGKATLSLVLMRLPGHPLETYLAPSTKKRLEDCELRERGLQEFFGKLPSGSIDEGQAAAQSRAKCEAIAFRPLAWDMTALTLQWEQKEREISVVKVETTDPEQRVYRAAVRFAGIDNLVDVWLSADGGRLRLCLFDNDGHLAGLSTDRTVAASAFQGTWHRTEPRTARNFGKNMDADMETEETLVVSLATNGSATISHQLRRHIYLNENRLACNGGSTIELGLEQSFSGPLSNGTIVAPKQREPRAIGADMARCSAAFTYAPDQVAMLKVVDKKLIMYRTDGVAFVEAAEFQR